jgi:hypothetical protein
MSVKPSTIRLIILLNIIIIPIVWLYKKGEI